MKIRHFKKKPISVPMVQVTRATGAAIAKWVGYGAVWYPNGSSWQDGAFVQINTREGGMAARIGDWVARGVEGEFYPIKDSIHKTTYEEVDE